MGFVTEANELAPIAVDARLCSWRVFGVSGSYTDRPGDGWSSTARSGLHSGDEVTLTIGEIPRHVVEGMRAFYAGTQFMLRYLVAGEFSDSGLEERDVILQGLAHEAEHVEEAVRGKFSMWLTLEVCRPMRLQAHPTARYAWVRDDRLTTELLDKFAHEAGDFLDRAATALLPALGEELRPNRVLAGRRRTYVMAPGKAALGLPDITASGSGHAVRSGWAQLPFEKVGAALQMVADMRPESGNLLRAASRWLFAALAEESDPLRKFLFAFFGLEVLANKVGKRVEGSVVQSLTVELGLPVTHLVWPTPREADSPWRSLTFRFAMMAVHLNREEASADIDTFRDLAKSRNDLSHGAATEEDVEQLPCHVAIELLQRYLSLAVEAESHQTLA